VLEKLPTAWVVKFLYNGELRRFITLDQARAIEFAAQHHGTVGTLYEWYDDTSCPPGDDDGP
jgi:hypothetical protein